MRGARLSEPSELARSGVVVTYSPHLQGLADSHEQATQIELSKRLAALKGWTFGGAYNASREYEVPVYFVSSDTLVDIARAHEIGIFNEHDLFGGVVPHAFIATKAITHPVLDQTSFAPPGWSHDFGKRVRDVVFSGFTVFTRDDAISAGACLLKHGSVRIKPVRQAGGRGQIVISNASELKRAIESLDPKELSHAGLVLEENLTEVTTYTVGHVRVADLLATYFGKQRLTTDNNNETVYGGSDLTVLRGDFELFAELDAPREVCVAIDHARVYDRAATACFPGIFASRRNYDVAWGRDSTGAWRCGVLEQSWRLGGASGAEILALEAFRADHDLELVRASTFEVYGKCTPPPPNAAITFRGVDERIGPLTKYALVLQ